MVRLFRWTGRPPAARADGARRRPVLRSCFVPQVEILERRTVLSTGFTSVPLSGFFNRTGISTDGTPVSGGLDGGGNALSANQLVATGLSNWQGLSWQIGPANQSDVVSGVGQSIPLPVGHYSDLMFLADAVNGNQANQVFVVTYTDSSTQVFVQSVSDWFTPQSYPGESIAATTDHRNKSNGQPDSRTFYVFGYQLALNPAKQVQSITLPVGGSGAGAGAVEVLAMDLLYATPVITVANPGGVYNGNPHAVTAASVVAPDGTTLATLGDPSLTLTYYQGGQVLSAAPIHPGTYSVIAHYAGGGTYNSTDSSPIPFTISPAPLTVTAVDQTKLYGAALPTFTANFSAFVNGEGPSDLSGSLTFTTTASAASHVSGSPYTITPGGLTSSDYAITFVNGSLTVTPAPLTVTAVDKSKLYGAALPTLSVLYSGLVNGDGPSALGGSLMIRTTATAASHVAGGPYAITPSGLTSTDYAITFRKGLLTITPAPVTVRADDKEKVYGAALPTLTATITGLVNGDAPSALGVLSLTTTATAASHVAGGPYSITPGGLSSTDYSIRFVLGHLTVTPAPLVVTADDIDKIYGAPLPALTVQYGGLVNGDQASVLGGSLTLGTTATVASHVADGPFPITVSGLTSTDYTITFKNGTLTVLPANLIVSVDGLVKLVGNPLPGFTVHYSGFVNGDDPSVLKGSLLFQTTATASSDVSGSPYPVVAAGLASSDYSITYLAGEVIVTPPPPSRAASSTFAANVNLLVSASGSAPPLGLFPTSSSAALSRSGLAAAAGPGGQGGSGGVLSSSSVSGGPSSPPAEASTEFVFDQAKQQVSVMSSVGFRPAASLRLSSTERPNSEADVGSSGGTDGLWDEDQDAEQERLFAALGLRSLSKDEDLFGKLLTDAVAPDDGAFRSAPDLVPESEQFSTTAAWFVLATVAGEAGALSLTRR